MWNYIVTKDWPLTPPQLWNFPPTTKTMAPPTFSQSVSPEQGNDFRFLHKKVIEEEEEKRKDLLIVQSVLLWELNEFLHTKCLQECIWHTARI